MKKPVYKLIERSTVGSRAISDRRFRVLLFTGAGLTWNLIYGIYNGVLSVISGSAWFGVLCAYYFVLSIMRFSVMPHRIPKSKENYDAKLMIFNGIILILLSFVLSLIVFFSFSDVVSRTFHKVQMIVIAAYTFYIAVFSVVNLIKAQKEKSAFLITVRNISLAAATVSVMSLERSIVASILPDGNRFRYQLDVSVGLIGFLIVLAIGISMIVMGMKRREPSDQ